MAGAPPRAHDLAPAVVLLLAFLAGRITARPVFQKDVYEQIGGPLDGACFEIVWDAAHLPPEDYVKLVVAMGDLVRSRGGRGIRRVESRGAVNEDRRRR